MKRLLFLAFFVCLFQNLNAQHDPGALSIIERMTSIINELESASFTLTNCRDFTNTEFALKTQCNQHDVFIGGPTKMLIKSSGDNGHREIYYNGTTFNYYNVDEKNYVTLSAPPTLMETLDTLHKMYEIDFPAADFFYPTLPEDLKKFCETISYAGTAIVNGVPCHQIIAENKDMYIQMWIRNDAATFPQKLIINYKKGKNITRYETIFSDWQIERKLPDAMFEFLPATDARKISILSSSKK